MANAISITSETSCLGTICVTDVGQISFTKRLGDVRRHAYFLSSKREFQNSVSGISTYLNTKHIFFFHFAQASEKWILRKTAILSCRS